MIPFIRKSLIFAAVTSLVAAVLLILPHAVLREVASFKLPHNPTMVLLGHSHPECAYDDALIDGFKNLASSGESPFYSFQKLRLILEQNPAVDTVFIEYSNNLINPTKDKWIWGDKSLNFFLPKYAPFMSREDFRLLYGKNPKGLVSSLSISARKNLYKLALLNTDYHDDIGGYLRLDRHKMKALLEEYEGKPIPEANLAEYKQSYHSSSMIKKMVDYCRHRKVEVYLVRTPQHRYYGSRRNEPLFMKQKERFLNDAEFLDFNDFPLADEEYGDFGHMNYKGAKRFSLWFNTLMEDGLLTRSDKQAFILERMTVLEDK